MSGVTEQKPRLTSCACTSILLSGVTYDRVEAPAKKAAKSKPSDDTLEEIPQNNYFAAMGEAFRSDC